MHSSRILLGTLGSLGLLLLACSGEDFSERARGGVKVTPSRS
jgi:hypothetical protein